MREYLSFKKATNILMFVMLVGTIFVPTIYNAEEITKELVSETSEVKDELNEIKSEITSEVNEVEENDKISESQNTNEDEKKTVDTANAPPVANEVEEVTTLTDLSNMTSEELEAYFDDETNEVLFIDTTKFELPEKYNYSVTPLVSPVPLSTFNSSMYGEFSIYKINGKYVYCLEPGVNVNSSASSTAQSGSIYNNFSLSTKIQIGRIISSSQEHYHATGNTDWLFAGQLQIWSYLSRHEASLLTHSYGTYDPYASSTYSSEATTIQNEIDDWNVRPSFMSSMQSTATKHTLKYNRANDNFELTLTDTNGVWDSKFANYGVHGNYTYSNPAGANNVKITATKESLSYSSAISSKWTPYASGDAEFYDAGQDFTYVGSDPIYAYMQFNTEESPLGGFTFTKTDLSTGDVLKGAEFKLYDSSNKVVDTYTTDSNGKVSSGMTVLEGDYTLKESKAPTGYLLNETSYPIKITAKEINTKYSTTPITNQVIKGQVELTKVGSNNCDKELNRPGEIKDCQTPLAGATFGIFPDSNSNGVWDKEEIKPTGVITTDENGYGISEKLRYGTYFVHEISAPNGYDMNGNTFKFSIRNDGEVVKLNKGIVIEDNQRMQRVHIQKTGNEIGNLNDETINLENAEYTIYNSDKEVVDVLTTDSEGQATSILMPYGDYTIQETKAPTGYVLDEEVYEFNVNNETYKNVIEYNFVDDVIEDEIEITKTDLSTGEEIPGAELQVIDRDSAEIIEEWTSTTEAYKFTAEYGSYAICEQAAPAGYQRLSQCVNFDVTEDGVVQKFKIENELIKLAVTGKDPRNFIVITVLVSILAFAVFGKKYINTVKQ